MGTFAVATLTLLVLVGSLLAARPRARVDLKVSRPYRESRVTIVATVTNRGHRPCSVRRVRAYYTKPPNSLQRTFMGRKMPEHKLFNLKAGPESIPGQSSAKYSTTVMPTPATYSSFGEEDTLWPAVEYNTGRWRTGRRVPPAIWNRPQA